MPGCNYLAMVHWPSFYIFLHLYFNITIEVSGCKSKQNACKSIILIFVCFMNIQKNICVHLLAMGTHYIGTYTFTHCLGATDEEIAAEAQRVVITPTISSGFVIVSDNSDSSLSQLNCQVFQDPVVYRV